MNEQLLRLEASCGWRGRGGIATQGAGNYSMQVVDTDVGALFPLSLASGWVGLGLWGHFGGESLVGHCDSREGPEVWERR